MFQIVTDLIGEMVEVRPYDGTATRGRVRAAFMAADKSGPGIAVEPRPEDSYNKIGELCFFYFHNVGGIRVVRQCLQCLQWDHPSQLEIRQRELGSHEMVHRPYVRGGCRENG